MIDRRAQVNLRNLLRSDTLTPVIECTGNYRDGAAGYDEGIDPVSEWPDAIGPLERRAFSPRSVELKNVRNEFDYAPNADLAFLTHESAS